MNEPDENGLSAVTAQLARFTQLFAQAPTFMALLEGPDHRITHTNPGYQRLVDDRDVIGRTVAEALPDAVAQGYCGLLDQVYRTGEAYAAVGWKFAVEAACGGAIHERFVDFVYQPIRDPSGAVIGIFVEGVDVTPRVLAERRRETLVRLTDALRLLDDSDGIAYAASQVLGETLEVSRVGYGTIDPEAETLHVARDWTAPGVESLAGSLRLRDYGSFIEGLKRNEFIAIADVRLDARTADAAPALEGRSARAFVNYPVVEAGRLVGVLYVNHAAVREWAAEDLSLFREVAERTRTAIARAISQAALRRANETLEAQVEERSRALLEAEASLRQSQKMEAVGQLTGGLAHDFNNILAGISGTLELMQTRLAQGRLEDVNRYLAGAQAAARRAASLTQRLLAFSRRQTLDPKPTDLNRLVGGMQELIRRTAGPAIAFESVAAAGLWTTLVDPGQLENALLNLCLNARDAMPDGGALTIETANRWLDDHAAAERGVAPGQYISLCVSDTGAGMAPQVIARAFDPFFTTKPIGGGTGLGLSMVYGFAGQSGGAVRIYSEIGRGTMVCIYLPRHLGDSEAETAAETGIPPAGGRETVLLVDDDPLVRMVARDQLDDLGYAVIEAADGPAAVRILLSAQPLDLLVTDVGLPGGMNGRQLADAARASRPRLQVLFITGYAENAVLSHGHLEPGMHVLTKPFTMEALARRVATLLA